MWFALPFGAGCALCQYLLPGPWRGWAAAAAVCAALAASLLREKRSRRALRIGALGLAAGMLWYAGYATLFLSPAQRLTGTEDAVTLELLDYPEETGYGARCTVRVLDGGLRGRAVYYGESALLALEPGDRVTAAVRYESADQVRGGESGYYTAQGIFARLYGQGKPEVEPGGHPGRYLPQRLARALRSAVDSLYRQSARGLILALLTGDREGLDEQSYRDLSEAGLMHITAVSGLHCGFLILLLGALVGRRQRLTALLGYPVLILYAMMVGGTPSVVRSCVMVGCMLLAPLAGREGDGPTSLSAALLVILLANPFAIASVSLQLSFGAVAGLLTVTPRLQAVWNARRPRLGRIGRGVWAFFTGALSASLGVMVLTAPLSAAYFGTLPLVSPLSNLAVLWMAPALFACALAGTVLCALVPALAPLTAVTELLARYLLWAAGVLADLPGHGVSFDGPGAVMWLVFVYTLLGICLLSRERRRKYLVALLAGAVGLGAVRALPRRVVRDDALTVVAVDVGQGAGTLLCSGGTAALVDCGSLGSPRQAGAAVARAMETYGWEKLDCVALTHYHADHAGGLASLLSRVEVERLLLPQLLDSQGQAALQREVLALAEQYGVAVEYVEEPMETALGSARLTVYPPVAEGDTNEEGLSVLCSAGEFDVLITGDMNAATERKLVERCALPDIEVLMAGHHGSRYSTSQALLEAARPEVGIISVGENSFGHPTEEAMGRMAAAGMTLYRTDRQGDLLIRVHPETGGTNAG